MNALLALLAASSAAGQAEPERCFASDTPTCRAARTARQARVYNLPPIADLRRRGVTARRAFFFTEWDRDVGAIVFSRAGRASPRLTVIRPGGGTPGPELSAPVPEAVWREVLAAGRGFEAPPPSLMTDEGQIVCTDAWLVHVEAADPRRAAREAVRMTCPGGAAVNYAYWLAARALALLPDCGLMEERYFLSDITRLNWCTRLGGDRRQAALAANVAFAFSMATLPQDAGVMSGQLAEQAELDWNGERAAGRAAVAARLTRAFADRERLFYRPDFFTANADGGVAVEGAFAEYVRDDEDQRLGYRIDLAPATLELRREADRRFRIVRVRVGPFERRVIGRPRQESVE